MYTEDSKENKSESVNLEPVKLTVLQMDLINRFKWHPPKNKDVGALHDTIRDQCLKLSSYITECVPEGRERALAITKLEEVMMWANAGIARNS